MSRKRVLWSVLVLGALVPVKGMAQIAPLLELDRGNVDFGLTLGNEGRLKGTATLRSPTLRVSAGKMKKGQQQAPPPAPGPAPKKPPGSGFPFDVDRLAVSDGAIVFVAPGGRELLRIHALEMTVENFTTRSKAAGGTETRINAKGKVGQSGQLGMSVKADPGTGPQNFSGHVEVTGLGLGELGAFADQTFNLQLLSGKFAMQLDFTVRDGRIDGTAKPSLSGVGIGGGAIGAADPTGVLGGLTKQLPADVLNRLPGGFGQPAPQPGSGGTRTPGGLSAVIPIHGTITPGAPLWTSLLDVLKTSVAESSSAGFLQLGKGVGQ